MTYKINDKPVTLDKFADVVMRRILGDLEIIEEMPDGDLVEIAGFSEISAYVDSIGEQITKARKGASALEYEKLTGHEMGVLHGAI